MQTNVWVEDTFSILVLLWLKLIWIIYDWKPSFMFICCRSPVECICGGELFGPPDRSVNVSCSSAADPPADNYTWYRTSASGSSSWFPLPLGSGPVLSLSSRWTLLLPGQEPIGWKQLNWGAANSEWSAQWVRREDQQLRPVHQL